MRTVSTYNVYTAEVGFLTWFDYAGGNSESAGTGPGGETLPHLRSPSGTFICGSTPRWRSPRNASGRPRGICLSILYGDSPSNDLFSRFV